MKKLNLGCGFDKRDGFVNANSFSACKDQLRRLANENWGVLKELHIQIKAIKP